jgi:hypothetical protein
MFFVLKHIKSQPKTNKEHEVLRIAKFHALIKAKHLGNILLVIYLITTTVLSIENLPSLYVLITHNLFPLLIRAALSSKHKVETLSLPLFAKKYNYTNISFQSNAMSFLCTCLFLYLWHQREFNKQNLTIFSLVPLLILLLIVALRIGGFFYYSKKFDHQLTYSQE